MTSSASAAASPARVCIVGSGPAGFYTAQHLLKGNPSVHVDIYDRLPVPFGLIRYGVAPDHADVKNVIHTFTQTIKKNDSRLNFVGNVEVGKDVTVEQLTNHYAAVVLCHGADQDRILGVPGENLQGVFSARSFVGWYNGVPEFRNLNPNLSAETAVIVGHGNVALDIARILLMPLEELKKTDICSFAYDAIAQSKIKRIVNVGRRGPLQVAFTIKELREMINLPGCRVVINRNKMLAVKGVLDALPRPRRRMTELLLHAALEPPAIPNPRSTWELKFLGSPMEIVPTADGKNCVAAMKIIRNKLEGPPCEAQLAVPTSRVDTIPCGLVIRSVGYVGRPLESTNFVPFDKQKSLIPSTSGRVEGRQGLYCSGWAKRGPTGVIASTMADAFETADTLLDDLRNGRVTALPSHKGREAVVLLLKEKGVFPVSFTDWEKIDLVETMLGERRGKPREKITEITEMLRIAAVSIL